LEEHDKLKVVTPETGVKFADPLLEEHDKLKIFK
jgi:hypothetical protein